MMWRIIVFAFLSLSWPTCAGHKEQDSNARANPMFRRMHTRSEIYLTDPPMVYDDDSQQYIPLVETPELIPWTPECPEVVDEPGYLEVLWGVVRDAFRFVMPSDTVTTTDGVSSAATVRARMVLDSSQTNILRVDGDSRLRVTLYAWDEKKKELSPAKLADDGGIGIKGGQTVYVKWLYGNDTSILGPVLRLKDLKWEVRKLRAMNAALCEWVTEFRIAEHQLKTTPAWSALRKACGQ